MRSLWNRARSNAASVTHHVPRTSRSAVKVDDKPPPPLRPAPCLEEGRAWYVVVAAVGREAKVRDELAGKGIPAFLPQRTVWRSHARVKRRILRPLFPRYLFVAAGLADWYMIRTSLDVVAVLGTEGRFLALPDAAVRRLSDRQSAGGYDETAPPPAPFAPGERVEMTAGLHGWVDSVLGDRASVRMQMFGSERIVQVALADLKAVA